MIRNDRRELDHSRVWHLWQVIPKHTYYGAEGGGPYFIEECTRCGLVRTTALRNYSRYRESECPYHAFPRVWTEDDERDARYLRLLDHQIADRISVRSARVGERVRALPYGPRA